MFGVSLSQQLSCTTGDTESIYDPYLNINRNSYDMITIVVEVNFFFNFYILKYLIKKYILVIRLVFLKFNKLKLS